MEEINCVDHGSCNCFLEELKAYRERNYEMSMSIHASTKAYTELKNQYGEVADALRDANELTREFHKLLKCAMDTLDVIKKETHINPKEIATQALKHLKGKMSEEMP